MQEMDKRRPMLLWLAALCLLLAVAVGLILLLQPRQPEREPEDVTPVFAASAEENLFALFPVESPPAEETPMPAEQTMELNVTPAPTLPDGFSLTVVSAGTAAPAKRVLIYHTHTYEAYTAEADAPYAETEAWRTADERHNMLRVGEELSALLASLGFAVTHDTGVYEPPDLTGAYGRSLQMLQARQEAGERYDLYIDLHRDAYIESQTGENAVVIGDERVARLMLLIGKGEGQTSEGFDQRPDWEANLALAQRVTDALNQQREGLCKPVRIKSGRFNQHIAPCCVLVEAGNNRNTLAEALSAMPYLADAIRAALAQEP